MIYQNFRADLKKDFRNQVGVQLLIVNMHIQQETMKKSTSENQENAPEKSFDWFKEEQVLV